MPDSVASSAAQPPAAPERLPPARQFSRRAKALALLLSLFVALVLGEILLRIAWHNPYRRESPDRVVSLRLPHALTDHIFDRTQIDSREPTVLFRTNERGYILPASRFDSPDATIAFLGGSTTECVAVAEDQRFPALVSTLLEKRGLKVNTLNAARSGNTLHDSINALFNHVVLDRPDIVVVMHAANDIGVLARDSRYESRMGATVSVGSLGKWAMQMSTRRSYILALARRLATGGELAPRDAAAAQWRNDPDRARTLPVEPFEARLRTLVDMCRNFGIEPVVVTQPLSGATNELTPAWADLGSQDRFNEIIRTVGAKQGATVIDLAGHLKRNVPDWDQPMKVFYDGMHVTDGGSQLYAEHIAEALLPVVRKVSAAKRPPGNVP